MNDPHRVLLFEDARMLARSMTIVGREQRFRRGVLGAAKNRLKRDEIGMNRHRALGYCLSMIISENRCTLFRIML
jgi:hypothetical protein